MAEKQKPGTALSAPAGRNCHASWSRPDTSGFSPANLQSQPSTEAIVKALGGHRAGAGWLVHCPAHDDRTPSLSVRDAGGTILFKCHAGCDQRNVLEALRDLGLWYACPTSTGRSTHQKKQPSPPSMSEATDVSPLWKGIWKDGVDPRNTLVARYLAGRHLLLPDLACGGSLRFHPRTAWRDRDGVLHWGPAMLALMRDPVSGDPCGLHRTFLTDDGCKHEQANKRFLGEKGMIMLSPDEQVGIGLYLAEGIETGLAVLQLYGGPVWVAPDAGTLAVFPLLGGIEALTIFADHDASGTGQEAALALVDRYAANSRQALALMPREQGKDAADLVDINGEAG